MENAIKDYLEQAKIGRKQSYKNLAVFPLISAYRLNLEYLLLDEAPPSALLLDDQILHLCIFVRENGRERHVSSSRIERFSRRRGYRM